MISIPSTLKISFRALWVNKMRSSLTMLGIIIGVGAVIAMLAVGTGASRKISQQIASIGSNLIIVIPGSITQGGVRLGAGAQSTLNRDDAEAIRRECPAVQAVSSEMRRAAQVVFGNQNWATAITGVEPGMLEVRDWDLANGRNFSERMSGTPRRSASWGRRWRTASSAAWIPSARSSGSGKFLSWSWGFWIKRASRPSARTRTT
jgi:putative ABC transport system permease protein